MTSKRSITSRRLSVGHEGAPPRLQLDESGRRQLHQRLADRCAGDAEAGGKRLLVQSLAWPQTPVTMSCSS